MYGLGERTALWTKRWPLIALPECVAQVEATREAEKEGVLWNLPCGECPVNQSCLTSKRKELGALLYDREIRTKPRSGASSLFPFEAMKPMLHPRLSLVETFRKPFGAEEEWAVCSGWDVAWGEKAGGDYLCKFTGKVHKPTGVKTILDIERWQRLTFMEQCRLMEEHWKRYHDDIVVIEEDFSQRVWVQYLSEMTAVPVLGHSAGAKKSLTEGLPGLLVDVERKKWIIPFSPDGYHAPMVRTWLSEAEAFGWKNDKLEGVGEHDDTVMAWYHCSYGLNLTLGQGWGPRKVRTTDVRGVEI